MINSVFLRLEELFSKVIKGEFDCLPYQLAVELEAVTNAAWDEVDVLLTEIEDSTID